MKRVCASRESQNENGVCVWSREKTTGISIDVVNDDQ
jgi:hypothetical protein